MRRIEGIIEVEEIIEVIDVGTTVPVRCRLQNGMNVVVKYMRNPFGQQVLINELIGSWIADVIGLTIPEYGLCNLSNEVIFNTNDNDEIDENNSGIAFYTKEYSKTAPPSRMLLPLVRNREVEKLILFDHIVNNHDRHKGNLLCDISMGATLYTIDNSHIITKAMNCTIESIEKELDYESILSKSILKENREVYDLLCTGIGYNEAKMFDEAKKIKSILTSEVISTIEKNIPEMWINSVGSDKISKMFEVLKTRINLIERICEMIVEERRKL